MHEHRILCSREERAVLQRTRDESVHHWRIMTSAASLAEQLATGQHLGVNATTLMVQLEPAATARLLAVLELVVLAEPVPVPSTLRFRFDEQLASSC